MQPPESLVAVAVARGSIEVKRSYDVWGLGVVFWEVFEHGAEPYDAIDTAREILAALRNQYRLPGPELCPPEVYALMRQCWHVRGLPFSLWRIQMC